MIFYPLIERTGFVYEFDIPEKSIFTMLDKERFDRILQNLVDNAVRYNKIGTKVKVSLFKDETDSVILFKDDGCGISKNLSEDIFKPFVRTDYSVSSESGGSGLGLSIAKKTALTYGGDLTLLTDVDQGCTFKIMLPLTQDR